MEKTADAIINASPEQIEELRELLSAAQLGVFTLDDGGSPRCPQGYVWSASAGQCILDVG